MFDRTRSGVADKNRRRRTWSWCFLVEQALQEHETKRRMSSFVFAQRRPHSLFVRARPRVRVGAMRRVCRCGTKMREKICCQNRVLTSLLPLALIRGKVALVSVLIGCEPRGVFPPFLLNRKSTLDDVMA